MEINTNKNTLDLTLEDTSHKEIVIFHVTAMSSEYDPYTNSLAIKMETLAKENNLDVRVMMDSASKIDTRGKQADIILLTPELHSMEDDVKAKFPNKIVKVIDQKDYGFLQAANVLKLALQ